MWMKAKSAILEYQKLYLFRIYTNLFGEISIKVTEISLIHF